MFHPGILQFQAKHFGCVFLFPEGSGFYMFLCCFLCYFLVLIEQIRTPKTTTDEPTTDVALATPTPRTAPPRGL